MIAWLTRRLGDLLHGAATYRPTQAYRYRKGMERPDVKHMDRLGRQKYDEVLAAQGRLTAAARTARRLEWARFRRPA